MAAILFNLLKDQIAAQGYKVITAMDGEETLDKVKSEKPNVIVLDMVIPRIDGTEIILRMKGDKSTMRIPIIVITGADVGHAKAQVLNSFSIPALSKPWQESELLDRIEGALLGAAALSQKKS